MAKLLLKALILSTALLPLFDQVKAATLSEIHPSEAKIIVRLTPKEAIMLAERVGDTVVIETSRLGVRLHAVVESLHERTAILGLQEDVSFLAERELLIFTDKEIRPNIRNSLHSPAQHFLSGTSRLDFGLQYHHGRRQIDDQDEANYNGTTIAFQPIFHLDQKIRTYFFEYQRFQASTGLKPKDSEKSQAIRFGLVYVPAENYFLALSYATEDFEIKRAITATSYNVARPELTGGYDFGSFGLALSYANALQTNLTTKVEGQSSSEISRIDIPARLGFDLWYHGLKRSYFFTSKLVLPGDDEKETAERLRFSLGTMQRLDALRSFDLRLNWNQSGHNQGQLFAEAPALSLYGAYRQRFTRKTDWSFGAEYGQGEKTTDESKVYENHFHLFAGFSYDLY